MTVKELALQLGVSEQAVRQRCNSSGIKIETTREGKKAELSALSIAAIKGLYADRFASSDEQDQIMKLREQLKQAKDKEEQLTIKNLDMSEIAAKSEKAVEDLTKQVEDLRQQLEMQKQLTEVQAQIANERRLAIDREHETVALLTARLPAPRRSVRQWFHDTFMKTEQKP